MTKIINGSTIYLALADYLATNAYLNDTAQDVLVMVAKWIDEAPEVNRWIPVTERLPEDDLPKGSNVKQIKVMTALKSDKGVRTVRSQMRFRCTWHSDYAPWAWKYSGSEITHWMPMPKPPKEVE